MGIAATEPPTELITVKVINDSNHAIRLASVSFRHQDKPDYQLVSFAFAFKQEFPQVIAPHDAGEVHFNAARLRSGEASLDVYRPVAALARLSTGEEFESSSAPLLHRAS